MTCGQHTLLACTAHASPPATPSHHQPLPIRPLLDHSTSRRACCSSCERAAAALRAEKQQHSLFNIKTGQDQLQLTPQRPVSTCPSFLKQIPSPTFCVSCRPTSTASARYARSHLVSYSYLFSAAFSLYISQPFRFSDGVRRFPSP